MLNSKSSKVLVITIGVLVLLASIAVLLGIYSFFKEKPQTPNAGPSDSGSVSYEAKNIVIEVVDKNSNITKYEITTHADYLERAMNEAEGLTYETKDGMVMVVNGVRADYVLDGAYWGFFVNDNYCNYGIADQPVNNKDRFRIVYTES